MTCHIFSDHSIQRFLRSHVTAVPGLYIDICLRTPGFELAQLLSTSGRNITALPLHRVCNRQDDILGQRNRKGRRGP